MSTYLPEPACNCPHCMRHFAEPQPQNEALSPTYVSPLTLDLLSQLGLTREEVQVVLWVMQGQSKQQIAQLLGVNLFVAQEYMATAQNKLGTTVAADAIVATLKRLIAYQLD